MMARSAAGVASLATGRVIIAVDWGREGVLTLVGFRRSKGLGILDL